MSPELAALAVHDLKNALGTLEAQLLALEANPHAEAARSARLHCEQMRREMVAFLTLYRDEGLRALVEDESPLALVQHLAGSAGRAAPQLQVQAMRCDDAPQFWYFDVRLVRLALDAALHNACRYARSAVRIDATHRDGYLVLSVEDDGPGLAATAGAGDAWSTGLGTELCRAVARAHRVGERQGSVSLQDLPQGGARFELCLP
jgi:signal transduction histidine kinase